MAHNHLDACPSLASGLSEDCSCDKEKEHYINLAKPVILVSALLYVGGILTGSGALISEATHQLFDSAESITNAIVSHFSRKWDEKRARWWGVKIGAILLLIAGHLIISDGLERIQNPSPVSGWMTLFAIAGISLTFWLRKKHHGALKEHHNVNHILQDWHFLFDLAINGSVLIGGTIMWLKGGWYFIDGYLMITIGVVVGILALARIMGIEFHTHDHGNKHTEHKHGHECNHKH